ncbi:MAG: SWIM zinc finger family protein, partial [Myxococcota bacterium]
MEFDFRYFGQTTVDSAVDRTGLSFAPDTRREPTYFRGRLRQRLAFRECISALHHVVTSDERFRPKDRTAYLEWRSQQDELDLAELAAAQEATSRELGPLREELERLRKRQTEARRDFYRAQDRYFAWLFLRDMTYWLVLDPVITVHPDEVFFECFSLDESSYGRVGCSYEVFDDLGEVACGTTNVDYSQNLYDEFQKIRTYKDTELTVDPRGFEVQTTGETAYREVKIDLPDSWVRGFLQVSSAMTLPGVRFDLHPIDVHNFCLWLRRHRETRSPRSIRFHLDPGQPVRATFEPWNHTITCARSPFTGSEATEIRVWGRRRLHLLERLVPVARRFTVVLLGSGMPSFWVADCGDLSFTLGLSGWTSNDWSGQANFDLLAPRADVDADT